MSNASLTYGVFGTIAGSVLPIRRAEELIVTLPGVLSVRIVPGDSGAIDEIHVLTTDAVPPKSTVRNIESALMAHLGMRVNHRKISVATTLESPRVREQSAEAAAPERVSERVVDSIPPRPGAAAPVERVVHTAGGAMPGPFRDEVPGVMSAGRRVLMFEDVEVRRSRTKGVLCRVTLSRGDSHFVGEAEGQESERSRVELAARATLSAISQAASSPSGGERSLALEGAKVIDAFDRDFVFVSVTARLGRDMVVLTGSCEVRESAETSSVLSVLDATNRWLHLER